MVVSRDCATFAVINNINRDYETTILLADALPLLTACVDEEEFDNTPQGNFEALWKIIDEHYCFLNYKHEAYGLDWQQVYDKYRVRIDNDMSSKQLFEVLAGMLGELRDGHVNLNAAHDMGRYWSWYEDYPTNFSDTLLRRYMGTDYQIASGIKYKILDDNIGYMRYESFNDGIGEGNLDESSVAASSLTYATTAAACSPTPRNWRPASVRS